jgi:hypothetical protein
MPTQLEIGVPEESSSAVLLRVAPIQQPPLFVSLIETSD